MARDATLFSRYRAHCKRGRLRSSPNQLQELLLERVTFFRNSDKSDVETCKQLNIPLKEGWNYSVSRKELKSEINLERFIEPISYRPFDNRKIFYHDAIVWRTAKQVLLNMTKAGNLALCTLRRPRNELVGNFFVTNKITDKCIISSLDNAQVFPLYLYPTEKRGLFDEETSTKQPNFSGKFVGELFAKLNTTFKPELIKDLPPKNKPYLGSSNSLSVSPEDIFNYAYAVFHSPTYRARYAEFLKIDFPRLPLTSNYQLFFQLARFGELLVELHLLENDIETDVTFPEKGSNEVEFAKFIEQSEIPNPKSQIGKVWINKTQYFDNVPETAWNFHIGGYQVLQKWLKDRKGRTLTFDDLEHYAKVAAALAQTIELMNSIDETIADNGGFPIE